MGAAKQLVDDIIKAPVQWTKDAIGSVTGTNSSSSSYLDSEASVGSTVASAQSYAGEDEDTEDAVELGSSRSSKKGRATGRKTLMATQSTDSTAGSSGLKV